MRSKSLKRLKYVVFPNVKLTQRRRTFDRLVVLRLVNMLGVLKIADPRFWSKTLSAASKRPHSGNFYVVEDPNNPGLNKSETQSP